MNRPPASAHQGDRPPLGESQPIVELRDVGKRFGTVQALRGVSMKVYPREVHCLLGDNGAGKSTLIKILSGVHQPDEGEMLVDGRLRRFASPREAMADGIATVHQDLGMIPLMSITRNFFLGSEPLRGWGPFKRIDLDQANEVARRELLEIGINVRDINQLVGTLSGGERQSVAIARACHFGARLLILDEPTSALGVKEAGVVLRYVTQARARGLPVIFITHNVHHAYPVGDRFTLLNRGESYGTFTKAETTREQVLHLMAGGEELVDLSHELAEFARADQDPAEAELARSLKEEAERTT
jgi:simple sugar transport system ATP-binding protein